MYLHWAVIIYPYLAYNIKKGILLLFRIGCSCQFVIA